MCDDEKPEKLECQTVGTREYQFTVSVNYHCGHSPVE